MADVGSTRVSMDEPPGSRTFHRYRIRAVWRDNSGAIMLWLSRACSTRNVGLPQFRSKKAAVRPEAVSLDSKQEGFCVSKSKAGRTVILLTLEDTSNGNSNL
jgi:hypothetical protein